MCIYSNFQQSSSLRRKPFTVGVMIINGNGQQIQVCNLLILKTTNVAWLNWHVAYHLTKKIEISPKKCANLIQRFLRGLATLQFYYNTNSFNSSLLSIHKICKILKSLFRNHILFFFTFRELSF